MPQPRRIPWWLFGLNIVLLAVLFAGVLFIEHGLTGQAARDLTHWTARLYFTFFLLAFSASALVQMRPGGFSKWLLRNRRYLGLNFALAHLVHLWALVTFFHLSATHPPIMTIVFGGLAYVLIAALAATSNDWSVRTLGATWRRLHLTGVWYLWTIFTFTWLGQAVRHGKGYWMVLAFAFAGAVLRVVAARRREVRNAS